MPGERDASQRPTQGPTQRLGEVETTLVDLLKLVREARETENAHVARIVQLEHENNALHLALQKIKEQRAKDRAVIEKWRTFTSQEYTQSSKASHAVLHAELSHDNSTNAHDSRIGALAVSQNTQLKHDQASSAVPSLKSHIENAQDTDGLPTDALTTDALTQERPEVIASSPPPPSPPPPPPLPGSSLSQQQSGIGLSQRILPMSIDVDELYEGKAGTQQQVQSDEHEISASSDGARLDAGLELPLKRPASEYVAHATKRATHQSEPSAVLTKSSDSFLHELLNRVWHPSDFVINPTPRAGGAGASHAFVEVVRSRERRQCMHGRDCQSCAQFFKLVGTDAIASSSRHRSEFAMQETPVGFWRTEFPDSDDAATDRAQAQAQWASEGQRRLLEAVSQGKYLFKDKTLRETIRIRLSERK